MFYARWTHLLQSLFTADQARWTGMETHPSKLRSLSQGKESSRPSLGDASPRISEGTWNPEPSIPSRNTPPRLPRRLKPSNWSALSSDFHCVMAIFDMPLESFVYANTSRQTQYYKQAKHRKTALYYIYHMFKRLIHTKKKIFASFALQRAPAGDATRR